MTTPFQSRQFSVQLPESAVGPASIAGAKANQQTGRRNIIGYAGPVSGQGSDMTTLAEAANVAAPDAVSLATGMRNAEGPAGCREVTKGGGALAVYVLLL